MEDLLNMWREFSVIGALRASSWKEINNEDLSCVQYFSFWKVMSLLCEKC